MVGIQLITLDWMSKDIGRAQSWNELIHKVQLNFQWHVFYRFSGCRESALGGGGSGNVRDKEILIYEFLIGNLIANM